MNLNIFKAYQTPIILALACAVFHFSFAHGLERTDFIKLISLYAALFYLSFKLIQIQKHNFWFLAGLAIIFRLIPLWSLPELSQDFYRFIWDGRLIAKAWNPYQFVPDDLILRPNFSIAQASELLKGMGSLSSGHYSNYAPLNQLIFAIAGWLSPKSITGAVIIFRIAIILADVGILYYGRKLLRSMKIPEYRIFWYILNPFVIIEMTGNLHFESVMVFLLVLSVYLLHHGKWFWSAVFLGMSVSIKLLPLMFLPLLFKYFIQAVGSLGMKGFRRLLLYYLVCISTVIISFIPFYSAEVVSNFFRSVGLWFGKFEFNASIYYIVRWIGFQVKGYNIIETAGKILPFITILIILGLSLFRKNKNTKQLLTNMLLAVTAYLLLSTTVHPWYLAIPLILSVFTEYKYMIIWTAVVMLSYFAYSNADYSENLWLITLEYLLVFFYMLKESLLKPRPVSA
ncbi:glycosyltransferase 87 family protein [Christiangramia sabulilitoris]|uniref:Mannosyltransferase n=1 Tax=Christiangramia sabulilitoris TaxID=2583991 RepID=A0A550I096_9FLAO|nr:glycosyltransferase 87 family protein [Christiangramia sabulilitoris]TRO64402.1 mannosyltransferase [Christiangramia sabulilitoris]